MVTQTIKLRPMSERPKNNMLYYVVKKSGDILINDASEQLYGYNNTGKGWFYADEIKFEVEAE